MATTAPAAEPRREVSPQQVLMVLAGLVVILALVWFFLLRGGGGEEETAAPTPASTEDTEPAPSPEPSPTKKGPDKGPVETFEVFAPRDPFDPLLTSATGGGGGVPSGDVAAGEDATGGGEGETTQGGGGGGGNGSRSIEGHRVRLIDVFSENGSQRAQIQVDGVIFTVDEGEVFADNFQLLEISGDCATMLFGDDQFTLCEGEEILK